MTPDLNPVITTRLNKIRAWCRTPRHIKARNAQIAKHPKCSRCGRPATCILHESPGDYEHGYDHYVGLIERGERPTGCAACNRMERSGRRPCPSCVKKYARDPTVRIHYITRDQETCRYCEPGYDPEKSKFKREHWNRIRNANNHRIYLERKAARAQVSA
jgi:hypothetical protein